MVGKTELPRNDDGTLAAYAWPGGYPLFYMDRENSTLCVDCARKSDTVDEVPQFRPIAAAINYEDGDLYCGQCSCRIESAYGEEG